MLRKALILCFITLVTACKTTPEGYQSGTERYWQEQVDEFYKKGGESHLLPYVKAVRHFDSVSEVEVCTDENFEKLDQALELNPSSLFVYTVKFECANRQQNTELATTYREKLGSLAKAISRDRTGTKPANAIEIREIDEAYILLELSGAFSFGYEIEALGDSFVYKFHVFDMDENRFEYRYFDNSRFLGKMYSDMNAQQLNESQVTLMTLTSLQEERSESVLLPMARYQIRKGNYAKAIEILTQIAWPTALVDTLLADAYHKTGDQVAVDRLLRKVQQHSINGFADASIFLAAHELVTGEARKDEIRRLVLEVDRTVKPHYGALLLAKSLSAYEQHEALIKKWLSQESEQQYWLQLTEVAKQIRNETGGHKSELTLLSLAAEKGSSEALWRLAMLYRDGKLVNRDYTAALTYLKKSADAGYAAAQLDLGYYYDIGGLGLNRDLKSAFHWYQQASLQGNTTAHHNIGLFYETGTYVQRDINQAIRFFERAISGGYKKSYCALGDIYAEDRQYLNLEKAIQLYQAGASAGISECMNNLGYTYSEYLKDYPKALYWYQLAAQKGSGHALNSLGRMYEYGEGVEKSYAKAFEYYEKGAKQNNTSAITNLGLFYSKGWGVKQDRQKALKLYRQAAEAGNYASAFNLGNAYYYGNGVEQNWQVAADYYQNAASWGYPTALCFAGMVNRENNQLELAQAQLTKGAKSGLTRCQWELGVLFEIGKRDYVSAKYWFEQAAKKNYSDAYHSLGILYENGYLGEEDYEKARMNYTRAAELGHSISQANLGFMYESGRGVEVNNEMAFKYYLMSAAQGEAQGLNNAGTFYFHGIATEQDRQKGLDYYRKAAVLDNKFALNNLGKAYRDGKGVEVNFETALAYFERSLKLGFPAAYEAAGVMYYRGQGISKDYLKAVEYLTVASESGFEIASFFLGEIYLDDNSGVKDIDKAIDYFTLSSEQGDVDAPYYLGEIYYKGLAGPRDFEKAKAWYSKAVESNNSYSYEPLAAIYWQAGQTDKAFELLKEYSDTEEENFNFVMGMFFHFGDYLEPDYQQAMHYYQLGADDGHKGSINNLGELYRFGKDLDVDYAKAIELYQRAAKLGSLHAKFNLAEMHRDGHGFEVNLNKAFHLFSQAAQEGFLDAMYQLGLMYQDGKGTNVNQELATKWLRKSAEQGYQPAIDYLQQSNQTVR